MVAGSASAPAAFYISGQHEHLPIYPRDGQGIRPKPREVLRVFLLRTISIRIGPFQVVDQPVPHVVQIQWHWDCPEAADCHLYVELPPALAVSLERAHARGVPLCAPPSAQGTNIVYDLQFPPPLRKAGTTVTRICGHHLPHFCSKALHGSIPAIVCISRLHFDPYLIYAIAEPRDARPCFAEPRDARPCFGRSIHWAARDTRFL